MEETFEQQLKQKIEIIEKALDATLPRADSYPPVIHEAMRYSVFSGGKRLRPVLLVSAYELFAATIEECLPLACAIEFIHTYSLIHDDLPAMDNDDFRRGKPTCHKAFGEGMAVLAGDALLNYAFEIMLMDVMRNPSHISAAVAIAKASGVGGMIGGQVMDLLYEDKPADPSVLHYIHQHKTAALICAAVKAGALAAGAEQRYVDIMERYGLALGMAFQINDDILDMDEGGKEDEKTTYPALYGLEASVQAVRRFTQEAVDAVSALGQKGTFFKKMALYMMQRRH